MGQVDYFCGPGGLFLEVGGGLPLFTENPRRLIPGNPHSPGPIGPTFSRGAYYPLPTGPKALREALSGCAGAPVRFAVLRVEVCSSTGPLFPWGLRT